MNSNTIKTIIRFIIIIAIQVLVLKHIQFDSGILSYGQLILYPVLILLLPLKIPKTIVLFIAFATGIIIDMFYDSPGVHTAALLITAYMRNIIMNLISPYDGYKNKDNPSIKDMGTAWVFTYSSILLFIHLFFYFSIEAFSMVYIYEITMKTIFSFLLSISVVMLYQFIFRPNN